MFCYLRVCMFFLSFESKTLRCCSCLCVFVCCFALACHSWFGVISVCFSSTPLSDRREVGFYKWRRRRIWYWRGEVPVNCQPN